MLTYVNLIVCVVVPLVYVVMLLLLQLHGIKFEFGRRRDPLLAWMGIQSINECKCCKERLVTGYFNRYALPLDYSNDEPFKSGFASFALFHSFI